MKILLFADIGSNKNGFYHAGDEAMFLSTYDWYQRNFPKAELNILSRSISHEDLNLTERLHFPYHHNKWRKNYFLNFIFKIFVLRFFKINLFDKDQLELVKHISSQSVIHFCGGGNMYSIYYPWFYYSLIVIIIAKLYGKKVIMTSQTIGPFWNIERIYGPLILNFVDFIVLREPVVNRLSLIKYGIIFPNLLGMVDVSCYLGSKSNLKIPSRNNYLKVGLSVHSLENFRKKEKQYTIFLLTELAKKYNIEVVCIPHLLLKDNKVGLGFMEDIVKKLPYKIKIVKYTNKNLLNAKPNPSVAIKDLTSQVDLLIATRYHGIVFALTQNVPAVAYILDTYYRRKNSKVMEMYYHTEAKNYVIDLNNEPKELLLERTIKIIENLSEEKMKLRNKNSKLMKSKKFFNMRSLKKILKST